MVVASFRDQSFKQACVLFHFFAQFEERASSSSRHLGPMALDLDCVIEMSQRLSAVLNVEDLISSFLELVVTHTDATKVSCLLSRKNVYEKVPSIIYSFLFVAHILQGILFLSNRDNINDETMETESQNLVIRAKVMADTQPEAKLLCVPYDEEERSCSDFSNRIVNYVWRTKSDLLLRDALNNEQFACDPYLKKMKKTRSSGPVSILCAAVTFKQKHYGVIFLENNVNFGAFNDERRKLIRILISQFMISYENAQLVAALKQKNDELKKKNEELKEVDKMKDSFLAVNNHELRTPLNGIMGITSLLEETALDGEQREYVKDIKSCSESLLKITNDMLYLCKLKAMKVTLESKIFCLSECLETCMKVVESSAFQKGLILNYLVEPNVPQLVIGDYLRLRQILLNLLNNAIKFTDQGEVVISVSVNESKDDLKENKQQHSRTTAKLSKKNRFPPEEPGQTDCNFESLEEGRGIIRSKETEELRRRADKVELHFQVKDTGTFFSPTL